MHKKGMVDIDFSLITKEDLNFFSKVRNSCAEIFLHDSRKFTTEETLDWFEKNKPEFYIVKMNGFKIGYFRTSNLDLSNKSIYIGCDLEEQYRGKGLGFICYKKFIPFISNKYNLKIIYLEVLSTNYVAIRLYEKLGFIENKDFNEKVLKSGQFIDSKKMFLDLEKYFQYILL